MKRVKITNGLYGYRPEGAKHPRPVSAGGLCVVTDTEAARLASLGVGVVLEDIPEKDTTGAVATPVEGEDGAGTGVDTPGQDEPAEGEETAHLDPEQLKELTNAKLKELAEEMGIDTAKLKTKAQLIAAITDVPLEDAISGEEDDEGAPAGLGAEGPVE
nr:MAG TPA: HeH/LEM domain [Caudoviricetes sp.]